jgi:two-component system, NarL family, nitrate/nitrite response regulator NarL
MQPPTRVFIVAEDDKKRKLSRIFEEAAGFVVVGATATASASLAAESVDVRIIQATHLSQLVHPAEATVPTLYLLSDGSSQVQQLSSAGAVLPADASPAQIRAAAMALAAGLQIARKTRPARIEGETEFAFVEPLTERELRVLNFLADGLTNPQIARRLNISRNTVKFHVSSIISKLGATSRTEAVTTGVKRGLIIL